MGHRAGDDLIQSFSSALKKACVVHNIMPFVGRYGGDEFIVFYNNVSGDEEIKIFMKELDYYVDEFNERETRFQISFAVGYAFISDETEEELTNRQLFDMADSAMYEDKLSKKSANNQNYEDN